jgi:protein O-GlcNAc transferase
MTTISEALAIAVGHHQAGRLLDAEQIYRQILAVEPNNADAWNLLGVVNSQRGNHQVALDCIGRAIRRDPNFAAYHECLGQAYQRVKKWDEAVACYRRALELIPDCADTHNNLGTVLQEQGQRDEAVDCYRRALQLKPNLVEAHANLGNVFKDQGKQDEAVDCYRRALQLKPNFAEVHSNLGNVLNVQGKRVEAVACYRRALELKPDYAEAHFNLASTLREQGKRDEALAGYRRALELKPDSADTYNNLGIVLQEQGKPDEAVACYRRALELKSDFDRAHFNLGCTLRDQEKRDEAVACYRRAVELKPDYGVAMSALVHELQHICRWEDVERLSERVIQFVDEEAKHANAIPISPFSFLTLPTITTAEQQFRCARQWVARRLKSPVELPRGPAWARTRDHNSKITVGYVSADFHSHATARLIAELIEKHDRGYFSIIGYSFGPDDGSPMRRRLVNAFDRFVDLKDTAFEESAECIAADGVQIAVDLKGYTMDSRNEIFSFRPAPIQASYLGYPGTMGAPFIDYILVDDFVVPSDQQPFYTEKLVHLPGCYQVNDSQRVISLHTPSRAECGLPAQGFVFCCFNNNYKITPAVFGVWMKLLHGVPGSVLWLLEGNRFAPANLRREALARGVAAERLVFAPRLPLAEHLARHRVADLFLDTIPYNAHTTASEALWAGCPVLTVAGETFASRVAGSLLRTLGLPELITTCLDEYEQLALRLARDPKQLADLRARLQTNKSTSALFDGGQFARNLEKAYVTMLEMYASGEQPRAFRVSPA